LFEEREGNKIYCHRIKQQLCVKYRIDILGKATINLKTGVTINKRLLAQTAVTLQMNAVTQPQ